MDIFLVRHGEAAARWGQHADPGLSDLGRQQAESVAAELAERLAPDTLLCSSPLARARETAAPLAHGLAADVVVDEAYREIPAPVPLAQRQDWLRAFMRQRWDEQVPELLEWRDGVLRQLRAPGRPLVVFTHFLVINAVVGRVTGREETLCFWPDNGSWTHLRVDGERLDVVSLGREMRTVVN